jgi:hypothetical protein
MSRRFLLPVLFLLGSLCLHASDGTPDPTPSLSTPSPVINPALVDAHFHEVIARPEYQELAEPDVGSRIKDWLSQCFMHLGIKFGQFQYAGEMPVFASLLMTILAVFALAGLLYVAVRLNRRRAGMEAEPSTHLPTGKMFHSPEFYDDEIEQATQNKDWRRAWLASWRQFLSRLENRRLVEADRTRTNREYLAQLRDQSLPAPVFALLIGMVDAYDRFVYGRKIIGEPDWNQFHEQIQEAALLLHLNDKISTARISPRTGAVS